MHDCQWTESKKTNDSALIDIVSTFAALGYVSYCSKMLVL